MLARKPRVSCASCCVGWDAAGRHTVVQCLHTAVSVRARLLTKVCCCLA